MWVDKYVLEELLKREGSLGGEQSGHIIMPDLSLAGDGHDYRAKPHSSNG